MNKFTAKVRVRDAHIDDVKATTIKEKYKIIKKTHVYCIWRCLQEKI